MNNPLHLIRQLIALSALVILITACASKQETSSAAQSSAPATTQEAQFVANEMDTPYVTEFSFKKGSTHLTPASKNQIKKIYQKAKDQGAVAEVKVISWADLEYASTTDKKLSNSQVKLAKKRNDQIQKYLTNLDKGVDVDTYNMAERPNVLQNLFSTDDARIKHSLEVAGVPNLNTSVKTPSKASHAIVMVIVK